MKVWIAFSGNYSSRGVVAVFTDEAKAHECSDDVEDYDLNEMADNLNQVVYSVDLYLTDGSERGHGKSSMFCAPHFKRSAVHSYLGWTHGSEASVYYERMHADKDGLVYFARGESAQSFDEALKLAAEARQSHLRKPE